MITVTVDVDVDLSDIDTEDLQDELDSRMGDGSSDSSLRESIAEMFEAFKLGNDAKAVTIARELAQQTTGRIL